MGKKIEIDLERAIEMYKDGAPTTEIGKVLGCGYKTVIKNLTEAGVYVPKRRGVGKSTCTTSSKPKVNKASGTTQRKATSKPKKDISYEDKVKYCNKKYGKGNWYFMPRDELMIALLYRD